MAILVRWRDDWFVGRVMDPPRNDCRFMLLAADDMKYEAMGFYRRPDSCDPRNRCCFTSDPGFRYFPVVKYAGVVVALESINPDAFSRQVYIRWLGYNIDDIPPDVEKWEGGNGRADFGFCRHVVIDDLEKEEGTIPDWSLPED